MKNGNFCIDGAVLRYIAVVAMFTDHIALCLMDFIPANVYFAGRAVGRLAYPIFSYCLVGGYYHTRNVFRYARRILAAALISEIPFNLMVGRSLFYPQSQNVMWTMLIGLGMLWLLGKIKPTGYPEDEHSENECAKNECAKNESSGKHTQPLNTTGKAYLQWLLIGAGKIAIVAIACIVAHLIHSDYEWEGILIIAMYTLMPGGIFDISRGNYPRYFFYAFYPVHMLLLVLIRGIAHIL